jgi:hypothetical protein
LIALLPGWLAPPVLADETSVTPASMPFTAQVGWGHESSTSPFLSLSDDGLFLIANGNTRTSGNYVRGAFSGMGDVHLGESLLGWAVNLDHKHSPATPALDFSMAMGNLTFGIPVSSTTTVGAGLGLQRMWVAGDLFRDVTTWSINASLGQPDGGVWVADMSFANNRHPSTYIDMNSRVLSVSLHRRQPLAWLGIEAVEMGVGYDREINEQGLDDLSQRRTYAHISAERKAGAMTLSAGLMAAFSRYDDTAMLGAPARRDRLVSWDVGVEWDMGSGHTLAIDAAYAVSKANSNLFDNSYRNLMLSWGVVW